MNQVKLTLLEITDKKNGYNMPIAKVQANGKIEVINRGWNEFDSIQEIDISDLKKLSSFANLSRDAGCFKEYHVHLEIYGAREGKPMPVWLYFQTWNKPEHQKFNKSYLQW